MPFPVILTVPKVSPILCQQPPNTEEKFKTDKYIADPAETGGMITIPISVYILDDESGIYSSLRQLDELGEVYEKVNQIWQPAGIQLQVRGFHRAPLSSSTLYELSRGEFRPFFSELQSQDSLPSPSLLNAFYIRDLGGPNGINPAGTRIFFVADEPSVFDERVTAHEIGHILGLHHTFDDPDRLIYPGTNGMKLTGEEIIVARYIATGLLSGAR